MDRLPAVLHQFHRLGSIPCRRQTVDAAGGKVDRDCNRNCGSCSAVYPAGAAAVTGRVVSQFSCDHGSGDSRLLSSDWKFFPGQNLDVLAVTRRKWCGLLYDRAGDGPIWARPVWGNLVGSGRHSAYFDAGIVADLCKLSGARRFSDSAQTQKLAAVLAVFGALDVPLVYFSIWFFRTQHPQPVIGRRWFDGPADVTRAADQLAGILMFRVSGLLVEVPAGKAAARVEEAYALESLAGAEDGARQAGATSLPLNRSPR